MDNFARNVVEVHYHHKFLDDDIERITYYLVNGRVHYIKGGHVRVIPHDCEIVRIGGFAGELLALDVAGDIHRHVPTTYIYRKLSLPEFNNGIVTDFNVMMNCLNVVISDGSLVSLSYDNQDHAQSVRSIDRQSYYVRFIDQHYIVDNYDNVHQIITLACYESKICNTESILTTFFTDLQHYYQHRHQKILNKCSQLSYDTEGVLWYDANVYRYSNNVPEINKDVTIPSDSAERIINIGEYGNGDVWFITEDHRLYQTRSILKICKFPHDEFTPRIRAASMLLHCPVYLDVDYNIWIQQGVLTKLPLQMVPLENKRFRTTKRAA